jgi:putative effector of murein hydrolase
MGGGDALMSLLGLVIISFGFRVYTQRDTMKRHFPEIVGATILSSIFSLFSTAFAAKAIGLSAGGCCLAAKQNLGQSASTMNAATAC